METVKVSWSGGKDSTCALMMHLEAGHKVKAVCYVPMLTAEIPLILKNHYEFIINTAERFRGMGAEVFIVSGMTYVDFVKDVKRSGVHQGGYKGFPYFLRAKCSFKRDSKEKAIRQCEVGYYDYEDIGIAADETERKGQLTEKKRSILCENNVTENDAFLYCRDRELLSPHYETGKRDGCALCPNAKAKERQLYFADFPQAFSIVLDLQEFVRQAMQLGLIPSNCSPLRNYKWFIEEDFQFSLFDKPGEIKYIIN